MRKVELAFCFGGSSMGQYHQLSMCALANWSPFLEQGQGTSLPFWDNTNLILRFSKGTMERDSTFYKQPLT